jgi:hypothetical protein
MNDEVFAARQFVLVTLRERHTGTPSTTLSELGEKANKRGKSFSYDTIKQAACELVADHKAKFIYPVSDAKVSERIEATPMDHVEEGQSGIAWMSEYWSELQEKYGGMWVAIKDFEVKFAAKNPKQLKKLLDAHPGLCPLLQQISKPNTERKWFAVF